MNAAQCCFLPGEVERRGADVPRTPQSGRLACLGERKTTADHVFELLLPKLDRSNGQARKVPGLIRNRSQEAFRGESAEGRGASPPKFRLRPLLLKARGGQEKRRKPRLGVWSTEDGNPLGWLGMMGLGIRAGAPLPHGGCLSRPPPEAAKRRGRGCPQAWPKGAMPEGNIHFLLHQE